MKALLCKNSILKLYLGHFLGFERVRGPDLGILGADFGLRQILGFGGRFWRQTLGFGRRKKHPSYKKISMYFYGHAPNWCIGVTRKADLSGWRTWFGGLGGRFWGLGGSGYDEVIYRLLEGLFSEEGRIH